MNQNIHYLTLPDGLTVYRHPNFSRAVFIGIAEDIFMLSPDGSLWKAMPTEIAELIKVAITDKHLSVIDGDIRSSSRLSRESFEYLRGLVCEENKGEDE
jgi:hypothetical protein